MNKETHIRRLEESHLAAIRSLDKIQCPQNWRTNDNKVEASLEIAAEEATILAQLASLKQSYPHVRGAFECLREADGYASQDLVFDISWQALIATLRYPRYVDDRADKDLDLGKFDTAFNRFATFFQSTAKIVRVKLGLD